MKICGNCGVSNTDDSLYCAGCGKELESATPNVQPMPNQQNNQQNAPAAVPPVFTQVQQPYFYQQPAESPYTYANPGQPNQNALQNIRELLASPLVLTLSVILFIQLVISKIVGNLSGNLAASFTTSKNQFGNMSNMISNNTSSFIFGLLVSGLMIAGILMIYFSAKNKNSAMSTAGFTLLRVLSIISLVFVCLIAVLLLIGSFIFIGGGNAIANGLFSEFDFGNLNGLNMDINEIIGILGGVLLVVTLIFGTLGIIFFISTINFLGSMSQTFKTGYPSAKGAGSFSVFCFVLGGFAALGTLMTLLSFSQISNPAVCILSFLSAALGTANYFILGILASKYKKLARFY